MNNKKLLMLLTFMCAAFSVTLCATEKNDSTKIYFSSAFDELKAMMEGKQTPSFERAVFISENPYHNNEYSFVDFQESINSHLFFIEKLAAANDFSDTMKYIPKVKANGRFDIDEILISPTKKKELYKNALNNWAIFTYMNDTIIVFPFYHLPFNYASSDPFGIIDWNNSQLMNLLASKKQEGNCYALTAFFKILADRLNSGAELCTAPQHIYIQHQDNKGDYYNVELATAGHPGDGMLQTLTYTTSTAIESGISLRSYDDRQSIGLCLVNLAKAYEHKFNTKDDDFLLKCAETVLQSDSLNLNALLLKHQVLNERMLKIRSKNKTVSLSKLTNEQTFKELEKHLARLQRLGYKQMPMDVQEMVLNGFQQKEGEKPIDRNPKPFTVEGIPEEDNRFLTLTGGLFQEVFYPQKFEEYGQFTFDTETKTIAAIDTSKKNVFLIDPVAFAYDFGARIYDARLGRFFSVDPFTKTFSGLTPYQFASNNPISNIDIDGLEGVQIVDHQAHTTTMVLQVLYVPAENAKNPNDKTSGYTKEEIALIKKGIEQYYNNGTFVDKNHKDENGKFYSVKLFVEFTEMKNWDEAIDAYVDRDGPTGAVAIAEYQKRETKGEGLGAAASASRGFINFARPPKSGNEKGFWDGHPNTHEIGHEFTDNHPLAPQWLTDMYLQDKDKAHNSVGGMFSKDYTYLNQSNVNLMLDILPKVTKESYETNKVKSNP